MVGLRLATDRARDTGTRTLTALAFAAAMAAAYSLAAPSTGDLAAQTYRAHLVARAGPTVWDNFWFGGHHLPAYSVVFPVLGALLSPVVAGAGAMFVAVLFFVVIVRPESTRTHVAALWFTVGMAANLVSGRLTFVLGIAVALAAVAVALRGWVSASALIGAATALASPVAASFLVLAGITIVAVDWHDARHRYAGAALVIAPAAVIGAANRLFPEGGTYPFPWWSCMQAVVLTALCIALIPRTAGHARVGLGVYATACLVTFAIPTPLGGNVVRLGTLLAGPVLVTVAARKRRYLMVGVAALLLAWQWEAPVNDLLLLRNDPSVHAAYYRPVVRFLDRQGPDPFRIEVPTTANHWESTFMARHIPLARGWERQLDRKYNGLFYGDKLTKHTYRQWLRDNGVRFVAVPKLPVRDFDFASRAEIGLVRAGLPYLNEVWRSRDWRVLRVGGGSGLVRGPAQMTALSTDEFRVHADVAARVTVRIRWSPNFYVTHGVACVGASPAGWTVLDVHTPGRVAVGAHLDVDDALAVHPNRCPRASR